MQKADDPKSEVRGPRTSVGLELPSLSGVLIGSVLLITGWTLMLSVIGIPAGLLLFAIGLGLMLTPKPRRTSESPVDAPR